MDRLKHALADDEEATAIALRSLYLVLARDDLPSSRCLLESYENNRRYRLAFPLLVAIAEANAKGEDICARDDDWIERSLVCYALAPLGDRKKPAWVDKLLACRPESVADAFLAAGESQIERNDGDLMDGEHLERLAADGRYATVAAKTALKLARCWPSRCSGSQAGALQSTLRIVLRHVRNNRDFADGVLALVDGKSAVEGMDVKQEATWLGFVTTRDSAELAAEKLVENWTGRLAQDPGIAAGTALKALAEDPYLASWRHIVEPKYRDWRIARRVDQYRVPSVREVQETLRSGSPANPADFVALLVEELEELANQIRHGNTDDWKQYWNVVRYGRATDPRPEDACRDVLLSGLRPRLATGVDAQPEGHYADDKRADIRVAYRDWAIPVEIKKNSHRQLWSAIKTQLITKYTRDPTSGGFGIYVALWFGAQHTKAVPPCGHHSKPSTSEEMKRCLEETLTDEQRQMITVVVIDVSRPNPSRRQSTSDQPASLS